MGGCLLNFQLIKAPFLCRECGATNKHQVASGAPRGAVWGSEGDGRIFKSLIPWRAISLPLPPKTHTEELELRAVVECRDMHGKVKQVLFPLSQLLNQRGFKSAKHLGSGGTPPGGGFSVCRPGLCVTCRSHGTTSRPSPFLTSSGSLFEMDCAVGHFALRVALGVGPRFRDYVVP